ncbi:MAG TPA: family 43 glycosylhydrolase [Roseimicrobium sp.]|nr:family 43 glycosylhydrolase [Roseimicrobium sp.]
MCFPRKGCPRDGGEWPAWGDQNDGTYRDPVLPADYSDIDCIRVGADYYAISSTFHHSPGVVILHSQDLINWRILGHAVNVGWGDYRGDRIGIFNYNNDGDAGYADCESCTYRYDSPATRAR